MDKFENMQQNKMSDEELDQISGGGKLFDALTAEFRGKKKDPKNLKMFLDPDGEKDYELTTLEMRVNPLDPKNDPQKIVKL